jgi:predicted DCC family thiol-disulfide oxidoreductase YuxK
MEIKRYSERIILFDGVCNLCNGTVRFIIKNDKKKKFKFASLQSFFGQENFKIEKVVSTKSSYLQSIILVFEGITYEKSDAVLEIMRNLSGFWPIFYILKFIPKIVRDNIYDLIAHNRYRVFGKTESCLLPTAENKSRFIE